LGGGEKIFFGPKRTGAKNHKSLGKERRVVKKKAMKQGGILISEGKFCHPRETNKGKKKQYGCDQPGGDGTAQTSFLGKG